MELTFGTELEAECERCRREQITKTFGNKKRIAEAWLRWRAYVDEVYSDGRARGCTTRHVGPQKNVGPGRSREDTHARVVTSLRSCLRTWLATSRRLPLRQGCRQHQAWASAVTRVIAAATTAAVATACVGARGVPQCCEAG